MKDKKVFVLYHENPLTICPDGMGSYYAAWAKFGDKATYIPVKYGEIFPIAGKLLDKQTEVYVLDFSYARETLVVLNDLVSKLVVIDHHNSAEKDLAGLDFAMFDMLKSGAVASWEYFHPDEEVPELLLIVQDRDLWKFEYSITRALTAAMYSSLFKREMSYWDKLARYRSDFMEEVQRGYIILDYMRSEINDFMNLDNKYFAIKDINGHKVAIYNTTTFISEKAEAILVSEEVDVDYVISYLLDAEGSVHLSFRTLPVKDVDVSIIAQQYGGGGKTCTAGAKMEGYNGRIKLSNLLM